MTCTTRCYSHVLVNVLVNIHAYSVVLVSLNVLVRTTFPQLCYTLPNQARRPNFLDDCRKSVPEHRVSRLRAARAARGG